MTLAPSVRDLFSCLEVSKLLTIVAGQPATWNDIPTSLLQAELNRRQIGTDRPACGTRGATQAYNTPLHVFALFLILILSTLGT